jgi:hypothetical protein
MSVTIRKKEEPRNTPLLNFLLIACVPVLLAFLGGISTGKSSGMNIKEYEAKLKDAEKQLNKAKEDFALLIILTDSLDVLKKGFSEEVNALERELDEVMEAGDVSSISRWEAKREITNKSYVVDIGLLKKEGEKINPDYQSIIKKSVGILEDYQLSQIMKLTILYNQQKELLNQGALDQLKNLQEETAQATEQANVESQLRDKDDEIKDLKRDLKDCQRSNNAAGDNAEPKNQIKKNVEAIRGEVIPLIPTTILSRRGDQARELLRGKLDAISEAVQSIK